MYRVLKNNIFYFAFFTELYKLEEARKQFKTYVNILATIKNENNQKYLVLRKKFYDEVPVDDTNMSMMSSTSMMSIPSEFGDSPMRFQPPPPYRLPPTIDTFKSSPVHQMPQPSSSSIPISMTTVGLPILESQTKEQYRDCVNEFQTAMTNFMDSNRVDVASRKNSFEQIIEDQTPPSLPPRKRIEHQRSVSRENSMEKQIEKEDNKENAQNPIQLINSNEEKNVSVKEAMLRFNRLASEEEAKIPSPISKPVKNKTEKVSLIDVLE
jgi:hypothetical protein